MSHATRRMRGLLHLSGVRGAFVGFGHEVGLALLAHLAPGGQLYLAGLVAETRWGRRYLEILHRAGEVAVPKDR